MKACFIALFLWAAIEHLTPAQSLPAVYLNDRDEATIPDSATHYRVVDRKSESASVYSVREYSLTGQLLLLGTLTSIDPPVRNGLFTWYHPNGSKAGQVHYREGEANGLYVAWYEDGRVSQRGEYANGQRVSRWLTVHRNGQKRSVGQYLAGRPVGEWRHYYQTGQLSAIELLSREKGPALAFFNEDGSPYVGKLQRRQLPVFPGGEEALRSFISHQTIYPKAARRKNITGKVYMSYTVDEQGRVGQVRVVRGLAPELDNEARRVMASLPAFLPGREYNVPTAMTFTVAITFAPTFTLFGGEHAPQRLPAEALAGSPDENY